jgi:hypothetical protein
LQVPSGAVLRVYLNSRLTIRMGQPVSATLLDPVYAYDRIVLPAGSVIDGHISQLYPVSRWRHVSAILNGDFTPLARSAVRFESIHLATGRTVTLDSAEALPLDSVFRPARPSKSKASAPATGRVAIAKHQVYHQIEGQLNGRSRGVYGVVLGPDRKDTLEELLVGRLPWHPQWVRKGTRFDAELNKPVSFGEVAIPVETAAIVRPSIPPDATVHARLLTVLNSRSSKPGDPVAAVLTEPLFGDNHRLLLPEGTQLSGSVKVVQPARMFHRGGRLRFTFENMAPPEGMLAAGILSGGVAPSSHPLQGQLSAAEQSTGSIQVDREGEVKATESNARFLGPLLAGVAAARAQDNDNERHATGAPSSNRGGRALGGFSGLGLLGTALAQSSHGAGTALGYWGLGISIYTNVISKGQETVFGKNHSVDIVLNPQRKSAPASHFQTGTF